MANTSEKSHEPESHVDKKAVDSKAAVDILAELRRQQEEQKQLIKEQRKIVNELRRHENIAHHVHDDHKYQVCLCEGTCNCRCVRVCCLHGCGVLYL